MSRRAKVPPLDAWEPRELAGTESATRPFLSPDGEWIAYFRAEPLLKVPADRGPVVRVATLPAVQAPLGANSGVWRPDGTIIVSLAVGPLLRVPAGGGEVATFADIPPDVALNLLSLLPDDSLLVGVNRAGGDARHRRARRWGTARRARRLRRVAPEIGALRPYHLRAPSAHRRIVGRALCRGSPRDHRRAVSDRQRGRAVRGAGRDAGLHRRATEPDASARVVLTGWRARRTGGRAARVDRRPLDFPGRHTAAGVRGRWRLGVRRVHGRATTPLCGWPATTSCSSGPRAPTRMGRWSPISVARWGHDEMFLTRLPSGGQIATVERRRRVDAVQPAGDAVFYRTLDNSFMSVPVVKRLDVSHAKADAAGVGVGTRGATYRARSDERPEPQENRLMDAHEANVNMLKMVSATFAYSLGIGLTFGSALVAVVAILR